MEYRCNNCNKNYSSYQSLWIHNKKFHNNSCLKKPDESVKSPIKFDEKQYNCRFCNKIYTNKNSRWSHEQKCKNDKFIQLQEENNKLKQIIKINDKKHNKQINNINNNLINNINNGTIDTKHINIVINQLGCEKIDSVPFNDILKILSTGNNMPITCIKNLNFNKNIPENHSFCTTTLEGKHFTRINHETQKPEKVNKIDFINEVLESSLKFLNSISILAEFDDYFREKIPSEYQNKMKEILENQNKFHEDLYFYTFAHLKRPF